jgi:hypothetical protein
MARLQIDGDELVLRFSRLEKLGAFRGDVRVALDDVREVSVTDNPFSEVRGVRAPGAGWPRRLALGTFRQLRGHEIYALYGRRPAVIVALRGTRPRRLIVTADDAEAVAERIRAALPG